MSHWDWTKANSSGTLGGPNEFISSTGLYEGNESSNTLASVIKIYEPIPKAALDIKVGRALTRMISNRITGVIGLPSGDSSIMPGKQFTLKGMGFFSGILKDIENNYVKNNKHDYLADNIYFITSVRRHSSSRGNMTSITFRLKDLERAKDKNGNDSISEHLNQPYTTYYIGREKQ